MGSGEHLIERRITLTQKTKAELITPAASFTGAPASATNGTMFTVTATSNEAGSYASVPTITASGACTGKCLICDHVFSRRESAGHANVVCWPEKKSSRSIRERLNGNAAH
ncbi:MAG TPA: hypothetical protein VIH78_12505 [Terriglobales bacterium]